MVVGNALGRLRTQTLSTKSPGRRPDASPRSRRGRHGGYEWLGMRLKGEPLHFFPGPVVIEMAKYYWGLESLYAESDLGYVSRDPLETLRDTVEWLQANHPNL